MKILGIGPIFSQGLGMMAWESALRSGWRRPGEVEAPFCPGGKRAVYQVDLNAVPDRTLLKKIRRADKVAKMAVLAAADALADSGIEMLGKTGIILATAFGAHVTTFDFLDGILDHGEAQVSPTTFSSSVHNAAASYVSSALSIQGPTLTVTQFRFSFQMALQLGKAWLEEGRCEHLLLGAVDQYGDVLGYVSEQKLPSAAEGKIRPFAFRAGQVPGEGAVFFLLGRKAEGKNYGRIDGIHLHDDPHSGRGVDLEVIDADGMLAEEFLYRSALLPGVPATAYAPLFGSMMTGSAFNLAAAALMLKEQTHFAVPVQDNPYGLRLLTETRPAGIETIRCLGCNCLGEKSFIYLRR